MKEILFDANAIISYLTDRNLGQQKIVEPYILKAANLEIEILILGTVLNDTVYVLNKVYNIPYEDIKEALKKLIQTPGIKIIQDLEIDEILKIWPDKVYDFSDAFIGAYCLKYRISVLTFDRDLKKNYCL